MGFNSASFNSLCQPKALAISTSTPWVPCGSRELPPKAGAAFLLHPPQHKTPLHSSATHLLSTPAHRPGLQDPTDLAWSVSPIFPTWPIAGRMPPLNFSILAQGGSPGPASPAPISLDASNSYKPSSM